MAKILSNEPAITVYGPGENLSVRTKYQGKTQNRVKSIFLAGTIDNGDSVDWQTDFINKLNAPLKAGSIEVYRVANVFNPRRKDWDSKWDVTLEAPEFYQQVTWEYDALCKADIIVMNILPDSKSPITLLELGMFADTGKILLVCPKQFYRKGNVDFVCEKYDIPQFENMDVLFNYIDNKI